MRIVVLVCGAAALAGFAVAQSDLPQPIDPEQLKWLSPPNNPVLRAAWVLGSEKEHGTYVLRVKLAKDGRIPAHTHPDSRYSTVLSGTLYVGFGETPDEFNPHQGFELRAVDANADTNIDDRIERSR